MRRRLVVSTIAIVLVVLAVLAAPVGIIVYRSAENELRGRLEQQVTTIAADLAGTLAPGEQPDDAAIDRLLNPDDGIRIISQDGEIVVERVPSSIDDPLVASGPGPANTTIELITDRSPLDDRVREQLLILLGLAAGALVAAAALAAVQARQLARPLERLAASAARIGDGDFSTTKLPATGIPEIDGISGALRVSSSRVDRMLSTERHFTADATHQLRTGLTAVAMRFELLARHELPDVVAEAQAGLTQTEQLNATIDELLAVTRDSSSRERGQFDLLALVDAHVAEWGARFAASRRTLAVVTVSTATVYGTKGLAGQVIDILIDNALRHGRGSVTLLVEGPSVLVVDQGPGISDEHARTVFEEPIDPGAAHGRGLPLARRLAQVDGGSVEIVEARPLRIRYRLVRAPSLRPGTDSEPPPGGGKPRGRPNGRE